MTTVQPAMRRERDLLGERDVPESAYYGIHTLRALENFPITGVPISIYPDFIKALACVKQAAALANYDVQLLDEASMSAIVAACEEIRAGHLHEHFVVDVIQGGAGTSTNMNVNEVIANRALELMGHERGAYVHLHPNQHVNMSQSTNDVYPTALKIALHAELGRLSAALATLRHAFAAKADEFADVIKMGRTQLQDAVPMTLGQEFGSYAATLERDERSLGDAAALIQEINLGATAIGTGLNAPPEYAALACQHLSRITGITLTTASNLIEATQDAVVFVQVCGVLKRVAVKLSKICNDLRLLSSGPCAGFGEINLPPRQAGSSIMPGKVNPVIPEVVNQIAFAVIGKDVTISFAAEAGQLQLNAFGPVIATKLVNSLQLLRQGCVTLAERCVDGITANSAWLQQSVEHSIGIVTALNSYIGYDNATAVAQEALESGRGVVELVLEKGWLTSVQLADLLKPARLAHPQLLPEIE